MNEHREILVKQHGVSIEYHHFEKQENLDLVHDLILQCSHLFPRWLKDLSISLYDQPPECNPNSQASVSPMNWEHGGVQFDLYSKFFDRTEDDQLRTIVHELVHIAHGKLLAFDTKYLLETIGEDHELLAEVFRQRHTEIIEEFTETMTDIIAGMM